jgi:ABC-type transporter MlaC component
MSGVDTCVAKMILFNRIHQMKAILRCLCLFGLLLTAGCDTKKAMEASVDELNAKNAQQALETLKNEAKRYPKDKGYEKAIQDQQKIVDDLWAKAKASKANQ